MKELWRSHTTGASIRLPANCVTPPLGTSALLFCFHRLKQNTRRLTKRLFSTLPVFDVRRLLTEPRRGFRRCLGATGPEEEAAVSELPLVSWTRLPGDAHLQQHHHIRRGERSGFISHAKWVDSVISVILSHSCDLNGMRWALIWFRQW